MVSIIKTLLSHLVARDKKTAAPSKQAFSSGKSVSDMRWFLAELAVNIALQDEELMYKPAAKGSTARFKRTETELLAVLKNTGISKWNAEKVTSVYSQIEKQMQDVGGLNATKMLFTSQVTPEGNDKPGRVRMKLTHGF